MRDGKRRQLECEAKARHRPDSGRAVLEKGVARYASSATATCAKGRRSRRQKALSSLKDMSLATVALLTMAIRGLLRGNDNWSGC